MRISQACGFLALLIACGAQIDPNDEIRMFRQKFKLDFDYIVSPPPKEDVTYEIKVQNLAGNLRLHDLTVLVEAIDMDQNVLWNRQHTLDVSEIAHHASGSFGFKVHPDSPRDIFRIKVRLAPDDDGAPFMDYREFQRGIVK